MVLQGHPCSQGQGHKIVNIHAVWKYLTQGICKTNIKTVPYILTDKWMNLKYDHTMTGHKNRNVHRSEWSEEKDRQTLVSPSTQTFVAVE